MALHIHIWACHHVGHVIIDIRHLGGGLGAGCIWQLLATMATQAHCLSNSSVSAHLH